MEYRDSSELQLLEVSRGVRKLTQMIDSWSKAPHLDARSKYIAKDLLRDSLALQESLITIRRLQETSRMMSFMEPKREFGFLEEKHVEDEGKSIEECGSLRFGVGIYDDIIHNLSTNGSSRNHIIEMKGAIRGKLNKQNDVSIFSKHGIAFSNRFIEFPTSSNFSLIENSQGMTDLAMRAKAPNLIAKLMGLEKIPSQVLQSVNKEQKNDKNIYKQTLDHEKLRIQSSFTGDARKPHVNGSEAPTIVIMEPLQSSHENKGEKQKKKENLPAELSLNKKVSGDEQMLNRKKAIKRIDKASMALLPKLRTQTSVTHKQQTKEPMAMGVNKVSILNGKKPEERRDAKVNSVPLFQTKRVKEPPAKPDKKLAAAKGRAQAVYIQSSTSRKNIPITNAKTISKHSATCLMEENKKKVENISGGSKNIKTANTKCKGVGKRAEPNNKASGFFSSFSSSSIHGFPQKLAEDSKLGYGENTRMGSKSFCEVMPKNNNGGRQRISMKAAMPPYDKTLALKEEAGPQEDAKLLLLTSADFLTEAEALFGFDVQIHRAKSYQNCSFEEFGARNPHDLLLGCAMELMARKSYQLELMNHPTIPTWGTYQKNSNLISLEKLVEDVSNGVKELNGYYSTADLKDNLYLRLERDLRCKNMILNASWDFGWIGWVCLEEFGGVVEQIGEQIICWMVGEVAFDLVH